MEYVNALRDVRVTLRETGAASTALVEPLVVMLAPYAPHFAEECWERLGHDTSVMDATWPAFDAALALDQQVEIVVQVNGKVRGRIAVARGTGEAAAVAAAKTESAVQTAILGKEVRKVVFVPDRVVNLVV
jgi:leucyl-tRNA synthetase